MKPLLAVKNWRTFQHYSDRRPPWIKLYVSLLDDLEFLALTESDQLALIKVWMLAARLGHPLPNDPRLLQNRGGVRPRAIASLIARGWLTPTDSASADASNNASTPLAEPEHSASPRARPRVPARASARSREGEGEGEREPSPSAACARWAEHLDGAAAEAAEAYRSAHPHPFDFDRALDQLAAPITGNGFGWPLVGRALVEMRANGAAWHLKLATGYCRRLAQGDLPPSAIARGGTARQAARRARNLQVLAAHAAGGLDG